MLSEPEVFGFDIKDRNRKREKREKVSTTISMKSSQSILQIPEFGVPCRRKHLDQSRGF